jgi:hypothetical protein
MRRPILIAAVLVMMFATWLPAEAIDDNAGTAGYSFLKIGVGARPAALGGAYVGLADDYAALYYNPAGITGIRLAEPWNDGEELTAAPRATYVAASYNSWISDLQSGFLALVSPLGERASFGASVQYMSYGDLIAADADGNRLGTFTASDMAFGLTGAYRLSARLSMGMTGRLILESIEDSTSWGMAADLGFLYTFADNRTRLGAAVTNLGAQMDGLTESHKDELPIQFALGASHKMRGLPLIVVGDVSKSSDDQIRFSLGSELVYFSPFYLRAGFSSRRADIETGSSNDKYAGFTGGFGVTFNSLRIDYALGQLSELGTVHRVGLTARL